MCGWSPWRACAVVCRCACRRWTAWRLWPPRLRLRPGAYNGCQSLCSLSFFFFIALCYEPLASLWSRFVPLALCASSPPSCPTSSPFPPSPPLHPVAALHCRQHPIIFVFLGRRRHCDLVNRGLDVLAAAFGGGFGLSPWRAYAASMLRASSAMTWRPMPSRPRIGPGA